MKIAILGCGWLGLPLAEALVSKGHIVNGSTTDADKLVSLSRKGINPFLLHLKPDELSGDVSSFLDVETLIVNLPPKLRKPPYENFVAKIQRLIPSVENSAVKNILFVSSTAVYANDNSLVTEATLEQPETESGRQLLAVEQLLMNNPNFKTTVIRFGGLIGPGRHPIKQLAGKKDLKNPEAPINLIHLIDCIEILQLILDKGLWDKTFNAVTPFHPTRRSYYHQMAKLHGLTPPTFQEDTFSSGKQISVNKLIFNTKHIFVVNNLLIKDVLFY